MNGNQWRVLAGALIISSIWSVLQAVAQTQQQVDWCVNQGNVFSLDQVIDGCTASIQSGKWSGEGLSWAYYNRGNAYDDKGDVDRAITDYTEAIRLDPKFALAYNNRENKNEDKGDIDRAIEENEQAMWLDPKDALA
jgi:tetratricopeptide (TPR) repeat protein